MKTPTFLTTVLSAPLLLAQTAEFTEVLVNPPGPNAGAQIVEIKSYGNPLDFAGWQLVTPAGTTPLPAVSVPYGQVTLLHLGQAGISTATDIYLPTVPELTTSSSLALFSSSQTNNPADLVDFVGWGGGLGAIAVAVQAGQWPSLTDTVTHQLLVSHTVAHYDQVTYGDRSHPSAWFLDGTPTLGAENDGGGLFAGAYGCPLLTYGPQLGHGGEDNRPWIGEPWPLYASYMPPTPSPLLVAIGTSNLGALPLGFLGITGCFWDVTPDAVVGFTAPALQGPLPLSIPNQTNLVGSVFLLQGMVVYPGANAANLLVTRVMHAHIGSR